VVLDASVRRAAEAEGGWIDDKRRGADAMTIENDGSFGPDTPSWPSEPFEIDGIRLEAGADGATIFYIPATPIPETDPVGHPSLSVLKTARSTTLQLGAHFDLDNATSAALPAKIAQKFATFAGARLQPASGSVRKASVVLVDGTGAETELATSTSSGFPPYAALFAITLTPAQGAEVISAVAGRRGVLFVDYLFQERGAEAPLRRRGDVATWFPDGEGMTHVRVLA
jgi:hypothetical protein